MPPGARSTPEVVRLAEATGSSPDSWEAAVADAVRSVRAEVPRPVGVEVIRQWAELGAGRVTTYRAAVRVAYRQATAPPRRGTAR